MDVRYSYAGLPVHQSASKCIKHLRILDQPSLVTSRTILLDLFNIILYNHLIFVDDLIPVHEDTSQSACRGERCEIASMPSCRLSMACKVRSLGDVLADSKGLNIPTVMILLIIEARAATKYEVHCRYLDRWQPRTRTEDDVCFG